MQFAHGWARMKPDYGKWGLAAWVELRKETFDIQLPTPNGCEFVNRTDHDRWVRGSLLLAGRPVASKGRRAR
jgi:hypothetical protein